MDTQSTGATTQPGRRRIAVANQGGGSHTAFTAGALMEILADDGLEVVGLSGASGGAVNALLAHYGLLSGGREEARRLLAGFWEANTARGYPNAFVNSWLVGAQRAQGAFGMLAANPYAYPEAAKGELARLISAFVDFGRLKELVARRPSPRLLVGAVDVLSGEHRLFDSARGEVSLEAVLASSAVPTLFRAVRVGEGLYWDGLFSQNPPVRELPGTGADEIWVVQIDPSAREKEPRTAPEVVDRRAQLSGNLSLEQELHFIETINRLVEGGHLVGTPHRRIPVRRVMLRRELDTASKLDSSPAFIAGLMDDGRREARAVIDALPAADPVPAQAAPAEGDPSGAARETASLRLAG